MADENTKEETISDKDQVVFNKVKMQQDLAMAYVEKALAQHEAAKLAYNNIILQLTIKYNLSQEDALTEDGAIKRNKESKVQDESK